ncbi:MAG: hypothetical protein JF607_00530 [Burkholderiales bacterium]|nr:hypothetical protein [Burkholderiales bacterium]
MTAKHLELIAETQADVDLDPLVRHLQAQGVQAMPMTVGLLVSGDVAQLRAILPGLTGADQDEVEVPESLRHAVKFIHVVKPRQPM